MADKRISQLTAVSLQTGDKIAIQRGTGNYAVDLAGFYAGTGGASLIGTAAGVTVEAALALKADNSALAGKANTTSLAANTGATLVGTSTGVTVETALGQKAVSSTLAGTTGAGLIGTSTGVTVEAALAALSATAVQFTGRASETIAANDFVHIGWSGTAVTISKANASNSALWANGYALSGIANGATGTVKGIGLNPCTVSTGGNQVWLSDATPGAFTLTAPTASGSIVQPLSTAPAIPGTGIFFSPLPWVQL